MASPTLDFEREFLSAFKGELRKVNELLPTELRNSGTACRVAAHSVGLKFEPQSREGRLLLMQHRQRTQADALYSIAGLGTDVREGTVERLSVREVRDEGGV